MHSEQLAAVRSLDWRRIGHAIGLFALVVIVAAFVVSSVPGLVGADESFVVRSDSMSPSIGAGSVVFVDRVSPETIRAGDVITFRTGDASTSGRVTHRVVEVVDGEERRFRTKGDANEDPDARTVSAAMVVGRVTFHLPLVGYGIDVVGTRLGLLVFVVLPAVLLVALELRDVARARNGAGGGK